MKYRIIILFLFFIMLHCASKRDYITLQTELEKKETFERIDVHIGLKGNFLFYVSNKNSEGDIYLYNLDAPSEWQITSIDNKNLQLISLSTFYRYIIYNTGDKNVIYDMDDEEEMDFEDFTYEEYHFSTFQNVNWVDEKKFYFLSSTNQKMTNIFSGCLNDDEKWSFKRPNFSDDFLYLNEKSIYSLSLSHNKGLLAFIAEDPIKMRYIFIWDLNNNKIKKIISIENTSELIWSENNEDIYYYGDHALYRINFKGAKNLIVSQSKKFHQLVYYPKYKYKLFYITTLNDYYFFHLKNIDHIGTGNFLFNVQSLKNTILYQKSDLLYYDNNNNEISYYNMKTTEIEKKILENASLKKIIYTH